MAMENSWSGLSNARKRSSKTVTVARNGPAPALQGDTGMQTTLGSIDGDMAKLDAMAQGPISASSKALLIYFAKLSRPGNTEVIDFEFIDALIGGGADINISDAHGQTVLHEAARNWHPDVVSFLLKYGANIDKTDKWGRTPLHLASAVNYPEMVEFLVKKDANPFAKTIGELQSPVHYAAKYNAAGSLKELIENGADVGDRDYKGRTPLYLAAENGREDTARYLIELGVPAGVFSNSGMSAMSLMVQKMPRVALDALNQFVIVDTAFRKEFFYLNYLEGDPKKWYEEYKRDLERKDNIYRDSNEDEDAILLQELGEESLTSSKSKQLDKGKIQAPSPLKVAVKCKELDVLMHPVMQQLIDVKWDRFGKLASVFVAAFHFVFLMIWTWLGIFLPADNIFYTPFGEKWWRIVLEIIGCLMMLCFIAKQIWEFKVGRADSNNWRQFRIKDLSLDLDYCHPRWVDEKVFIDAELKEIRRDKDRYFSDVWNIIDCVMYLCVTSLIVTRIMSVSLDNHKARQLHPKLYTFVLILLWLHFMKSCRPFTTLGPFILMLGHVISDTLRFMFLFFEFFIPFLCGFWIAFGGSINAKKVVDNGEESIDWESFNNLVYSVLQLTLIANFNFGAITSLDRLMAQILVGLYLMLTSVVCMNLYIALLSETFARVYQNARANATLLQAATILQFEGSLPDVRRRVIEQKVFLDSAPLEKYQKPCRDGDNNESILCNRMMRQIINRVGLCEDKLTGHGEASSQAQSGPNGNYSSSLSPTSPGSPSEISRMLQERQKTLNALQAQLKEVKLMCFHLFGNQGSEGNLKHQPPGLLRSESKTQKDDELLRRVLLEKMSDPQNVVPLQYQGR